MMREIIREVGPKTSRPAVGMICVDIPPDGEHKVHIYIYVLYRKYIRGGKFYYIDAL